MQENETSQRLLNSDMENCKNIVRFEEIYVKSKMK